MGSFIVNYENSLLSHKAYVSDKEDLFIYSQSVFATKAWAGSFIRGQLLIVCLIIGEIWS